MGAKVLVLMSTYNGGKYLREQINSILKQKEVETSLLVRDDGSSDNTINILQEYEKQGKLAWYSGENVGPGKSFIQLLLDAPNSEYYAFSDQDDIWEKDKLLSAVKYLKKNENKPSLYHSAVYTADSKGNIINISGSYNNYGFLNGDTHYVMGCTLVINKKLMDLLKKYKPQNYAMHDAWIHYVCLAVGGQIYFDDIPHIRYRQHSNNVVGGKTGIISSIKRRVCYLKRRPQRQMSKMLLEILLIYKKDMPRENIEKCQTVCEYHKSIKGKLALLKMSNFFRGRPWWALEQGILIILNRY